MLDFGNTALLLGGVLSTLASIAHLACIALGAPAYRFMGAGERMARAVQAGKIQPTLVTLAIASTLLVFAVYAFSGAGIAPPCHSRSWRWCSSALCIWCAPLPSRF